MDLTGRNATARIATVEAGDRFNSHGPLVPAKAALWTGH
jgi:hypothetical protein